MQVGTYLLLSWLPDRMTGQGASRRLAQAARLGRLAAPSGKVLPTHGGIRKTQSLLDYIWNQLGYRGVQQSSPPPPNRHTLYIETIAILCR
jgi:hypothetical protein